MSDRRRPRRPHHPGGLIDLLAADLPGHRLERTAPGRASFVAREGGSSFEVVERVDRRFLGNTVVAVFRLKVPAGAGAELRLSMRHGGRLKRTGVEVDAGANGEEAGRLAERLAADEAFSASALALDFTRFELTRKQGEWVAEAELIGASMVTIVFPPVRSYVRLYPDQRAALLDSFEALRSVLGSA